MKCNDLFFIHINNPGANDGTVLPGRFLAGPAPVNFRAVLPLAPFIPTGKACRSMNTNHLTTFRTKPFLFFFLNEMPDPKFIYHCEIVDHAHSIICSIALIQLFQPGTRKFATTVGTILDFATSNLFAISNSASITIF